MSPFYPRDVIHCDKLTSFYQVILLFLGLVWHQHIHDHIARTLKLPKQLKLLPVSDRLYLKDAGQMYKYMNGLALGYLEDSCTQIRRREISHFSTVEARVRSGYEIIIQPHKLENFNF